MKYKKCCAGKQEGAAQTAGPGAVMEELRELLQGQNFASIEEANAFMRQHMQLRNLAPIVDFHGLSSEQMHRLLYFPFDTPQLVSFPPRLATPPEAPILTLFKLLADGIGEQGLKTTATGNLPRNFCREAQQAYLDEEEYQKRSRYGALRTETDFGEMHVTRVVAEQAKLVRKYSGKFILTKEGEKVLAEPEQPALYPRLLRAYAEEFNWGYQDRYGEMPFFQQSFLFTLYLLTKYGGDWKSNSFYQDAFLGAFPDLASQVPPMGSYASSETVVRRCYSLRCLERFACFMGLAKMERPADRFAEEFKLRKLPLLDQVVQFHL
jgi:hypothetical protein